MDTKPWLKHYDTGVSHTLKPYPERTLMDVIGESASQRPESAALLFQGNAISYASLDQHSNALAAALVALGIQKGDRVALLLPNSPQLVIGEFGVWKAGAIAVPMNPLYTTHELEFAMNECGAGTVIVLTPFYEKVKSIQPRTRVDRVIATNIKEYLSPLMHFLFTILKEVKDGHRITLQPEDYWWEDLLGNHAGASRPQVPVEPEDPAIFLFSGGTTGAPKCDIGTHLTPGSAHEYWVLGSL